MTLFTEQLLIPHRMGGDTRWKVLCIDMFI